MDLLQFISLKKTNLLTNFATLSSVTSFYLHDSHLIPDLLPPRMHLDIRSFGIASLHSWQILKNYKTSQDRPSCWECAWSWGTVKDPAALWRLEESPVPDLASNQRFSPNSFLQWLAPAVKSPRLVHLPWCWPSTFLPKFGVTFSACWCHCLHLTPGSPEYQNDSVKLFFCRAGGDFCWFSVAM